MSLNPFDALANFFLGLVKQGKVQAWLRIIASMLMSAIVTGLGSWGIAILAGSNFLTACAISAVSISSVLITAWISNPESKTIPLFWTGKIETERQKILQQENIVGHTKDDDAKRG